MSINEKLFAKAKIETFDGLKIYNFQPLKTRDSLRLYFKTVQTLSATVAEAIGSADGVNMGNIAKAIRQIDYDTVMELAKPLLKGCNIKPDTSNLQHIIAVDDVEECDYFAENPEELYLAVYHALRINYPKSFGRLQEKIQGFAQNIQAKAAELTESSDTP